MKEAKRVHGILTSKHMYEKKSMFVEFDKLVNGDDSFGNDFNKVPVKGKVNIWNYLKYGDINLFQMFVTFKSLYQICKE